MRSEADARTRLVSRPPNLDFLLTRRTEILRRFLKPGGKILELGAGLGVTRLYVTGLDLISTDVVPRPWTDAVVDAQKIPYPDASFDGVLAMNVLHHVPHPKTALRELCRVLRPGGTMVVVEPHASLVLRAAIALTGHEYIDGSVDPYGIESCQTRPDKPVGGNNIIGDLLFNDMARFQEEFPGLTVVHHRLVECLTFLNSGGVGFRVPSVPLPRALLRLEGVLDDLLCRVSGVFPMCRELVFRKE